MQHAGADVAAEHVPAAVTARIGQQHRQGVDFLARGAGRAPDLQAPAGHDQAGQFVADQTEMLRLAEEIGLVGRQQVDHRLQFFRGTEWIAEQIDVAGVAAQTVMAQAARQAAGDQHPLLRTQVDPGELADPVAEPGEFLGGQGDRRTRARRLPGD